MNRHELVERYAGVFLSSAVVLVVLQSHLLAPPWYDENYSHYIFIANGPSRILTDYHLPNNHVLYNLGQWFWQAVAGDNLFWSRLFPLIGTLLAIPGLYLAGLKMSGKFAGVLAALLFATSHIVGNYAAQLRGYGWSLGLIAIVLGCGIAWWRSDFRDGRYYAGYVVAGTLSVGVLPTNALFVAVIGLWLSARIRPLTLQGFLRVLLMSALPALGLLVYAPMWQQFVNVASTGAWYSYMAFIKELARDLFALDLPWLLPVIGLGLVAMRDAAVRRSLILLLGLTGFILVLPAWSSVPWPRNYLPIVIVLSFVASVCIAQFLQRFPDTRSTRAGIAVLVAVVLLAAGRELIVRFHGPPENLGAQPRATTLMFPYQLRGDYNIDQVEDLFAKNSEPLLVVASSEAYWDAARVFLRPAAAARPWLICVVHADKPDCRKPGAHISGVRRLYVLDIDPEGPRALLNVMMRAGRLPHRLTLRPEILNGQFKVWSGEINIQFR